MSSFSVSNVTTYERGTIVSMYRFMPRMLPVLAIERNGVSITPSKEEMVWFYDRNDSGILDTDDLKISYDKHTDHDLREEPVSVADIDVFGKRVSHLFKKAINERAQLASLARRYKDVPQKSRATLGEMSRELPGLRGHLLVLSKDMIPRSPSCERALGLTNNRNMIDAAFYPTPKNTSILEGMMLYLTRAFYEDYEHYHVDLIPV